MAFSASGELYLSAGICSTVASLNVHAVFRLDPATNNISILLGTGASENGENVAASSLGLFNFPGAIGLDAANNIYFANDNRIRRIDAATGLVTTFAGSAASASSSGFSGDYGPAAAARLAGPSFFSFTPSLMFVSDNRNHAIRAIVL